MKIVRLKKIASGTTGSEIAEAALVIPILFLVLLGIYWFGRAFNSYATINHAAREGALVATMSTCASCGNGPAAPTTVASAVTAALQAAGLNSNQIQLYAPPSPTFCGGAVPSCNSANNNITICSNVQLTPPASPGLPVCGVSVSFQYPYNFSLPFPIPPYGSNVFNLQLKADVQMKGQY
jgi:Flp pilus assembly protein TadG